MTEQAARKPKIFAIANQKGGVGKTTTAINLGAALAAANLPTLVIDADPQGNASTGLGVDSRRRGVSTYEVLNAECTIADAIVETQVPNLFLVPATADLAGSEVELLTGAERPQYRLRDAFTAFCGSQQGRAFEYILIDCPPSLNVLTVNALTAADGVLVPLQCEFFAMEGLTQLAKTIGLIRERGLNPNLVIEGVLLTMHDSRTKLSDDVAADVRAYGAEKNVRVFETVIPRNVRLAEAPSHGKPAILYDLNAAGSQAYLAFARELIEANRALAAA